MPDIGKLFSDITNSSSQLGTAVEFMIALTGGLLVAFWVSLVLWTFHDISSRTNDIFAQLLAALMVFLLVPPLPIGLLFYFLLRPRETLDQVYDRQLEQEALLQGIEEQRACPHCHRAVEDDYRLCPHCHTSLKKPCTNCSRLLHLEWDVCPYCGTDVASPRVQALPAKEEEEEEPEPERTA